MKLNHKVFERQQFLQQTWQQQPRLLRQGLTAFDDLVTPEILAGLAMEDGVDARIVQCQTQPNGEPNQWQVSHGPFTEYDSLGEQGWTLLVQSVNEWLPDVGQLLAAFDFLPEWRLDDVMVSFSCAEGGVGPHLDQYDVFIIQGQGRRRWRVGNRQAMTNYQPCADLTLVQEPFEAVIDEVLEPGDVLYIPAGCPHDGVALEPSLNYSVGFRAPSQAEMLLQLGDLALQQEQLSSRYQDPQLAPHHGNHVIDPQQLECAKQWLKQALDSSDCDELILRIMSQSKRPLVEPEAPYCAAQVVDVLQQPNAILARAPGARWLADTSHNAYYSAGERFAINAELQAFAEYLAQIKLEQPARLLNEYMTRPGHAELLAELLNLGTFVIYLADD